MPDFIFRANIAHFEKLLGNETDAKSLILGARSLIAQEKNMVREWDEVSQSSPRINAQQGAVRISSSSGPAFMRPPIASV
jgi:hypothetical protein